jgi:hypothetical protein
LLQEQPEIFSGQKETAHELIVNWLLPYLNKLEAN